ncbi:heparin lyase I family protein [Chloroflexota bacterium]
MAGKQSLRFEVRPGDCSANEGFDDCPNDRSRHEINERFGTFNGEMAIYEANLYIPNQPNFKPRGNNAMFLNQLNTADMDQEYFGTLVFLRVDNNQNLLLQTHKGFSWDSDKQVVVASNIFERWINLRYEVYASPDSTGYFRVYIDDQLVLSESRPTILSGNGHLYFRVGIYNSSVSQADEAFENQVIFVDQMKKY